jgi:hypothetical protein
MRFFFIRTLATLATVLLYGLPGYAQTAVGTTSTGAQMVSTDQNVTFNIHYKISQNASNYAIVLCELLDINGEGLAMVNGVAFPTPAGAAEGNASIVLNVKATATPKVTKWMCDTESAPNTDMNFLRGTYKIFLRAGEKSLGSKTGLIKPTLVPRP